MRFLRGILAAFLLSLLSTDAKHMVLYESEGSPCTHHILKKTKCMTAENCPTMEAYLKEKLITLNDIVSCGLWDTKQLFCCPEDMPGKLCDHEFQGSVPIPTAAPITSTTGATHTTPMATTTTTTTTRGPTTVAAHTTIPKTTTSTATPLSRFANITTKHLVSLGYYKPVSLDAIIYRCTGIIVSPNFVLASAKCLGTAVEARPNRISFATTDPSSYSDNEFTIEIKGIRTYENELLLLELNEALSAEQLQTIVSVAEFCKKEDIDGTPNMFAIGYALYEDGTNCGLFQRQLRQGRPDECTLQTFRSVFREDRLVSTRLCLVPGVKIITRTTNEDDECTSCLIASTSVLHVQRPDGSHCIHAIATPANDECNVENGRLSYTNLMNELVQNFIRMNT